MTGVGGFYETDPLTGNRYQARRMVDGAAVDVVDYDGDFDGDGAWYWPSAIYQVSDDTGSWLLLYRGTKQHRGYWVFNCKRHDTLSGAVAAARASAR